MPKFTVNGSDLEAKKYPMPTKGTPVKIKVNDQEVEAKTTAGRGQAYTYFVYKNVALYVPGALEEGAEGVLDVPDDFGSDVEPAGRKSYYKSKKLNADGSIPAGGGSGSGDADGAAVTTDEGTADERSIDPISGETVITKEDAAKDPTQVVTNHDGVEEGTGTPVAPKNRRKGKKADQENAGAGAQDAAGTDGQGDKPEGSEIDQGDEGQAA